MKNVQNQIISANTLYTIYNLNSQQVCLIIYHIKYKSVYVLWN